MDDVVDEGNVCLLNRVGVSCAGEDRAEEITEDSVAEPLSERGDRDTAQQTVAGWTVAPESAVVVPALVGAVDVEVFFVLVHLKPWPDRVLVAHAVVLDKEFARLVLLLVHILPARRLGNEGSCDHYEAAEEALEPGDETP